MLPAVSNTSPINYLILIDEIEILPQLYSRILIPQAVALELGSEQSPKPVRSWAAQVPQWLEIREPAADVGEKLAELGAGERNAILLAQQTRADVLIIDDRLGSAEARLRGIAVTGTIGVLEKAGSLFLLEFAEAMNRLMATNFRIRRDIVDALLKKHLSS